MHLTDILCPLRESVTWPPDDPRDQAILRDMLSRANRARVCRWLLENGVDAADLEQEATFLPEFEYWLEQERSIRVSNGMVHFWQLDAPDIERMIGEHPVLLYHFTSSSRVAAIRKQGLVAGKRSVNRTKTAGVYLTTESSGPAINGYLRGAMRGTAKAYGVQISVRTFLRDLAPDPDDEDIQSGRTQFVTDYVSPAQIIAIERA